MTDQHSVFDLTTFWGQRLWGNTPLYGWELPYSRGGEHLGMDKRPSRLTDFGGTCQMPMIA